MQDFTPHTIAKKLKLERFWKIKTLDLIKANYYDGGLYLWLAVSRTWEPYCDVTENHPEISKQDLNFWIDPEQWERAILDNDFINIFGDVRKAKIWLTDNVKNIIGGGDVQGWPAIVLFNN